MEGGVKGTVCVTGAGGYVASWLVKLLLSKGYVVHGTVRDPGDQKNAHLMMLEGASERLQLFKADLLDYNSLCAAITGCNGVFHVASPVPSSSLRSIWLSQLSRVMDETCWSDKEYCNETKNWYCFSKTAAEIEAFEYAKRTGLDFVTVAPCLVLGPILQSTMNASSLFFVKLLRDGVETVQNKSHVIVDVRDVAEALLLTFENPEAEGRYICTSHIVKARDLVDKIRSRFPNYNYPKNFIEVEAETKVSYAKLQRLGWKFRPVEETLVDSVKSYQEAGILDKH